jgi:hypothetical protein
MDTLLPGTKAARCASIGANHMPPPWVMLLLLFENAPLGCLVVRVGKHALVM